MAYNLFAEGLENLIYQSFGMPQSRTSLRAELPQQANHVSFSVYELPNALYTYRFIVNNVVRENGKLIKE